MSGSKSIKSQTPAKSGKVAVNATPTKNGGISSVLVIIVLVIIFFFTGIYVGSMFVVEESKKPLVTLVGLPNTKKLLASAQVLKNEVNHYLRHEIPQAINHPPVIETSSIKPTIRKEPVDPSPASNANTNSKKEDSVRNVAAKSAGTPYRFISSLPASESCYVTGPSTLDYESILISTWIHLDADQMKDTDMRTIFSNKHPGCESSEKQHGISLYINGWQSNNHKLYLEFGGSSSGCHKVDSEDFKFNLNQWYHVVSYISPDVAALFVDGQVVARSSISNPHIVQTSNPLLIGQYSAEAQYPFNGNISDFVIVHDSSWYGDMAKISEAVKDLMELGTNSLSNVYAAYPLDYKKSSKVATDIIHGYHASYVCQHAGADGVKIRLVDGVNDRPVTDTMRQESDRLGKERREAIKAGMKHAWDGYKKYAWGRDELKPLSNRGNDNWGGIGMTLVDSLDTLWIMGMKDEFDEARRWVESSLTFDNAGTVSVFETTIRQLGGLLAAYDLSKEEVFLKKAEVLGEKLARSFETRSGIPTAMVNLRTGQPSGGWSGNNAILSELGTLQVEFRYLAHHVNSPHYEEVSMKPLKLMASKGGSHGLYPIKVRIDDGGFADSMITFGALGDSFYEYLLKVWIQGGKKEKWLRDMYDRAMDGAINKLLMASSPSGLAFLSDWNGQTNFRKMDHLVCFMPGLLTLGAYTNPEGLESKRSQRDIRVAKALMYTCREMYHRMATGISPEYVEFPQDQDMIAASNAPFYILRPETAESLFIMNQLTGDPIYREWAWEIWEAIDKYCRAGSGYGSLRNVNNRNGGVDDRMESFFLAETIKYLYLAQDPDKPVDLMKAVFNTEAHPLTILDDSHRPVNMK